MSFYGRFKTLCDEFQIDVNHAVTAIGLPPGELKEWENGKGCFDKETLVKIADYFAISVDYLTGLGFSLDAEHRIYAREKAKERVMGAIFDTAREENLTLGDLEAILKVAQNTVSSMMRASAIPAGSDTA